MIEQDIGVWNNLDGLRLYEPNMWSRRGNLHGATVRATCIKFPILTPEFYRDSDGNIIGGRGFMIDMLEMLEKDVNMTASLSLTVDGKFGGKTKNGSFNGMVGMLMRNETDVVVATLTYTPVRHKVSVSPVFGRSSENAQWNFFKTQRSARSENANLSADAVSVHCRQSPQNRMVV